MKELFEIYTVSGNLENVEEIKNEAKKINDSNLGGLDQLARYAINISDNTNILVELDISQLKEVSAVYLTAYEYSGNIEEYSCENEIGCEEFSGDWSNLKNEMVEFAKSLIK